MFTLSACRRRKRNEPLRCAACVAVMESADLRQRNNPAVFRWLDRMRFGRPFFESQMWGRGGISFRQEEGHARYGGRRPDRIVGLDLASHFHRLPAAPVTNRSLMLNTAKFAR